MEIKSGEGFVINYHSFYPHLCVGEENFNFKVGETDYKKEISFARPPGFIKNKKVFDLLSKVYPLGVTDENYLLIESKDKKDYSNVTHPPVYQNGNFVRHKILDVMGTLALTGRQFKNTEFNFNMTGHEFDIRALKKAFREGYF